jgi:hypothetical protein
MKYRRQTLAHRATDARPCVYQLTLAAQCYSVMARASDAAMLERQTLTSASVTSGVCSAASLGFDGRRATSVAEATDASVTFGQARGGSDRRSAASIGRLTDALSPSSAARSVLDRVCRCDRRAPAKRRTHLLLRKSTIGFRSLGHMARVRATDATVQRLSPPKNAQWVSNGSISLWSYK